MANIHLLLLSLSFAFLLPLSLAQGTWYDLFFLAQNFTSLSGEMHIPPLPHAGVYYLWYGLQPPDNSGVYQGVLDGRTGSWRIAPGWCCSNPSLPWGNGLDAAKGDVIHFTNTRNSTAWTSTVQNGKGEVVTSTFPLAEDKVFNQAIFAIELYGEKWDFGPLEFTNIQIVSQGTQKSWCSNKPAYATPAAKYTIGKVKSSVNVKDNATTCSISQLTLTQPA